MAPVSRQDRLAAAMPAVFVLIWSTGFIVARYGMPHAPPMKFLAMRYLLSVACFAVWAFAARAAMPADRNQGKHLAGTRILMHAGYLGGVAEAGDRRNPRSELPAGTGRPAQHHRRHPVSKALPRTLRRAHCQPCPV